MTIETKQDAEGEEEELRMKLYIVVTKDAEAVALSSASTFDSLSKIALLMQPTTLEVASPFLVVIDNFGDT